MEMKRCDRGHFYDMERNDSCPYCENIGNIGNLTNEGGLPKTIPLMGNGVSSETSNGSGMQKTRAMGADSSVKPGRGESGKNCGLIKTDIGIDPVMGWFVCIEGGDKGRDYRIRAENNFIGRIESMDICIRGDETISREGHAIVSYDMRNNCFWLSQGSTKGMVYLNNSPVFSPSRLNAYDIVELGKTKLMFIPFCGENFKWN